MAPSRAAPSPSRGEKELGPAQPSWTEPERFEKGPKNGQVWGGGCCWGFPPKFWIKNSQTQLDLGFFFVSVTRHIRPGDWLTEPAIFSSWLAYRLLSIPHEMSLAQVMEQQRIWKRNGMIASQVNQRISGSFQRQGTFLTLLTPLKFEGCESCRASGVVRF